MWRKEEGGEGDVNICMIYKPKKRQLLEAMTGLSGRRAGEYMSERQRQPGCTRCGPGSESSGL